MSRSEKYFYFFFSKRLFFFFNSIGFSVEFNLLLLSFVLFVCYLFYFQKCVFRLDVWGSPRVPLSRFVLGVASTRVGRSCAGPLPSVRRGLSGLFRRAVHSCPADTDFGWHFFWARPCSYRWRRRDHILTSRPRDTHCLVRPGGHSPVRLKCASRECRSCGSVGSGLLQVREICPDPTTSKGLYFCVCVWSDRLPEFPHRLFARPGRARICPMNISGGFGLSFPQSGHPTRLRMSLVLQEKQNTEPLK